MKGFATSGAVVLSCVVSRFLFSDYIGPLFYLGAAIVSGAAMAFSRASRPQEAHATGQPAYAVSRVAVREASGGSGERPCV